MRRPRRVLAVLLLAGLAAAVAWVLGRGAPPDAVVVQPSPEASTSAQARTPAPSPRSGPAVTSSAPPVVERPADPTSAAQWRTVVAALYEARARAFGTGSSDALDAVYTVRSPLHAADDAEIAAQRASGTEVRGFAPEVVEVRTAAVTGDRARLRLVDRWPAYRVVDGEAVRDLPGREERLVAMVLVRAHGGWRIDSARLLT